jgi:MYXO-CTERM domain-containing protein
VYGADEGAELAITVTVTDEEGDPVTFSWDLDDDGEFGELENVATHTFAAGTTDGPSTIRVTVQASDGTHTSTRRRSLSIRNVDPRIVSTPPTETSVGEHIEYEIEVEDPGAALDAPTYRVIRGPEGAAISPDGAFLWVPTELDVTMGTERVVIEIEVDDGDGAVALQSWEMTVSPNRAPEGMTVIYPTGGMAIVEGQPRLVVGNGRDADVGDMLTYSFQLDDEPEFAEPRLAESLDVPAGIGYTTFELPAPLAPGQYYWRAWMSDGAAETEPITATFWVVPDPRTPMIAMDVDGAIAGADAGVTEIPMEPRSSGCAVRNGGAGSGSALAGLLMLALGAVLARRRRR